MRLVGIATFSVFVETSFNRITCEFSGACCLPGTTTTGPGGDRSSTVAACENSPSNPAPDLEARQNSPCRAKIPKNGPFSAALGEFCLGSAAKGDLLGEFCTGEIAKKACGESFAVEVLLKALTVSVCMCARSPCGCLSSTGGNFACNSPQGISSYEIESLKFCRFCAVVYVGSAGIACDFWRAGEVCFDHWPRDGMWPEGAALTHAAAYGRERRVRHGTLRLTAAGRRARPQRMAGAPCSSVTMR